MKLKKWFTKEELPEEYTMRATVITSGSNYVTRTAKHLSENTWANKTKSAGDLQANQSFLTSDTVHTCADYIAKSVSQVRFKVHNYDSSNNSTYPVKDKRLNNMFNNSPNDYQTWSDLLYTATLSKLLTGNSYLTFEKLRSRYELWALTDPQHMDIQINSDGLVDSYKYGATINYNFDEIVHLKSPVLGNGYYGASVMESLVDSLLMEGYATQDIIKFYKDGLVSSSILTSEHPLTQKQADDLTESLSTKYNITNGRHNLVVLPNNLSIKPLRLNPKEAMLLDSLGISEDRVFSAFNLHKVLIGGKIDSYTNKLQDLLELQFTNAIRPIIVQIADSLQSFLQRVTKNQNLRLEVDLSNVPEINQAKLKHIDKARLLYTSGLGSLNEARDILGLPPIQAEIANQNHLPEYLLGSSLYTIQNITQEDIDKIRERNIGTQATKTTATDNLGGLNNGKVDNKGKTNEAS